MAERKSSLERPVVRVERNGAAQSRLDRIVAEEPLEIRVAGDTFAVTMRTPGHDHELALGLLFSEGIVREVADVGSITHCGRPGDEGFGNTIEITPAAGVVLDAHPHEATRRGTLISSACGVCGRRSIDDLMERCAPLPDSAPIALERFHTAVARLREHQPVFDRTGALHAAALFDASGALIASAEDVGRHNAVDKVIGSVLRAGTIAAPALPDASWLLAVSGRVSFEIIQKACVARFAAVCGISAPTTLAIELAERCRMTLAGFVRAEGLTLYTQGSPTPR